MRPNIRYEVRKIKPKYRSPYGLLRPWLVSEYVNGLLTAHWQFSDHQVAIGFAQEAAVTGTTVTQEAMKRWRVEHLGRRSRDYLASMVEHGGYDDILEGSPEGDPMMIRAILMRNMATFGGASQPLPKTTRWPPKHTWPLDLELSRPKINLRDVASGRY